MKSELPAKIVFETGSGEEKQRVGYYWLPRKTLVAVGGPVGNLYWTLRLRGRFYVAFTNGNTEEWPVVWSPLAVAARPPEDPESVLDSFVQACQEGNGTYDRSAGVFLADRAIAVTTKDGRRIELQGLTRLAFVDEIVPYSRDGFEEWLRSIRFCEENPANTCPPESG